MLRVKSTDLELLEPESKKRKKNKDALTEEISISGNGFITVTAGPNGGSEEITTLGLQNWESPSAKISIYFWMSKSEPLDVALRLRIPKMSQTTISLALVEVNGQQISGVIHETTITLALGGEYQNVNMGHFEIPDQPQDDRGFYVKFDLMGINRTGQFFGQVTHLLLSYNNPENSIVYNSFEESYFGRRGPSVHLRYPLATETEQEEYSAEYFYNEVHIPEGFDNVGMYAMACGFTGGYFGIQGADFNGPVQRRVLFSIWSDWDTEDPEQIPEDYKVCLVRKGPGVVVGTFGNEGSGAQSFVKFAWRAETTYKFLVQSIPIDSDNTQFTAWFKRPDSSNQDWQLVTSFLKPKVSIHLQSLYSFLENFIPETGHLERRAFYGNQWVRDTSGKWHELTQARFTGDATSKMGRRDFAGGVFEENNNNNNNLFYLRHCGFFSDNVETDQIFTRESQGNEPDVDVDNLP